MAVGDDQPVSAGKSSVGKSRIDRPEEPVAEGQVPCTCDPPRNRPGPTCIPPPTIHPSAPGPAHPPRRPGVTVNSRTLTKSRLSRCRHTPPASNWPGISRGGERSSAMANHEQLVNIGPSPADRRPCQQGRRHLPSTPAGFCSYACQAAHSSGLKQIRGSWLCPGPGPGIWRPPVSTGPRE